MPQPPYTKPIGIPFVELQSVDSTNNYARQQIHAASLPERQGLIQHGMTIFAHEQLSGKGQRGKGWSSEPGVNIMMSIVINPQPLLLSQQFMLSACVSVAIHDFFMKYAGSDTKIKWPNDLYWQDRKAGGVLVESVVGSRESGVGVQQSDSSNWHWSIVGIGININQTVFPTELPNPVSLKQITGKNFDPVELAKELCGIIEINFRNLMSENFSSIHEYYNECLYKRNEKVRLKKDSLVFDATIKSVSPTGKLIVHPDSYRDIKEDPIINGFDFREVEWIIQS